MIPIRGLRAPVPSCPPAPEPSRFRNRVGNTPKRYWTHDEDARLAELWAGGLSARSIAAEFGEGFSHNAIIGRAHRLGLQRRRDPVLRQEAAA